MGSALAKLVFRVLRGQIWSRMSGDSQFTASRVVSMIKDLVDSGDLDRELARAFEENREAAKELKDADELAEFRAAALKVLSFRPPPGDDEEEA